MTRRFAPALVAALLAAVPATGHAQFGKLMNKAKKAVGSEASATAAAQVPPKQVDALPANLTVADLDKAIAGFNAEIAAAPKAKDEADRRNKQLEQDQKNYEKAQAAYEKRSQEWNACRDKIDNDPALAKKQKEQEARGEANQKKANEIVNAEEMEAMAKRLEPAYRRMQAGTATEADKKAIAEFQAKMGQINAFNAQMMAENEKDQQDLKAVEARYRQCGEEPKAPKAPPSTGHSPEGVMQGAGAVAAGMSEDSYRMLREYAILSTNLRVTTKRYSQQDADAINQKLEQLQGITRQMQQAGIPL